MHLGLRSVFGLSGFSDFMQVGPLDNPTITLGVGWAMVVDALVIRLGQSWLSILVERQDLLQELILLLQPEP
jgi:hypothetical protein